MKVINKETGEIGYLYANKNENYNVLDENDKVLAVYETLEAVVGEWEDAPEEPKYFYCICTEGSINKYEVERYETETWVKHAKSIGNCFNTREEAEKAVEKLKALTKLCKKGFEFNSVEMFGGGLIRIEASIPINEKTTLQERSNIIDSLDLLFGGEE